MEGLLSILGKVGFDWQVALANFANFLIIFFILKKFAFKPIGKLIKERQEKIEKGLENAKQSENALSVANSKKEEIIKEAKENANLILVKTQEEKKKMIQSAKDEALSVKDDILKQAKIEALKEKERNEEDFKNEASSLVLAGLKKIVEGYVAQGRGEEIIKAMIKK